VTDHQLIYLDDGGGKCMPIVLHRVMPRRQHYQWWPLWEPHILLIYQFVWRMKQGTKYNVFLKLLKVLVDLCLVYIFPL